MLSADDENAGFDLVLDEDWYVQLQHEGKTVARFDPRDFTSSELHGEVKRLIERIRGNPSEHR